MKKTIALLAALLVATPALADGRHSQYREYREHHRSGWVAPLIGGVVLGALLADASAKQKERENARRVIVVKEPQQRCEEVTIVVQNRWGDILERRTEYRCTEY